MVPLERGPGFSKMIVSWLGWSFTQAMPARGACVNPVIGNRVSLDTVAYLSTLCRSAARWEHESSGGKTGHDSSCLVAFSSANSQSLVLSVGA